MSGPSGPSKRFASWLPFATAICVPLIVLAVLGIFSFGQTRHEAELRAQRTVQALAEHALRTFRAHDLIIHAIDGHIAGWDWSAINRSRELHDFFQGLIRSANDVNTIFVVGPTGVDGNSSLVFPLAPTNMPKRAQTVAVATPCWPAPVSAMIRFLPRRLANRIWPMALLILWAPVWSRSSRFR